MIVLISYIAAVYQPLSHISETIGNAAPEHGVPERVDVDPRREAGGVEKPDAIDIGRTRGAIEFENVSFSYKGRQDTLKDVSFKCEAAIASPSSVRPAPARRRS